jgi:hypothetical protein
MLLGGILSTMNIWSDKLSDIRISLNDLYMIGLMTSWMFVFMGIFMNEHIYWQFGIVFVLLILFLIRNQIGVDIKSYYRQMIPHHSMAVFLSKKQLENAKNNYEKLFLENIIRTQEREIELMKAF